MFEDLILALAAIGSYVVLMKCWGVYRFFKQTNEGGSGRFKHWSDPMG